MLDIEAIRELVNLAEEMAAMPLGLTLKKYTDLIGD